MPLGVHCHLEIPMEMVDAGPLDGTHWCQPWINKPRLRLFNWEGAIKKYQIIYDYWRSTPPNFHKPWFSNSSGVDSYRKFRGSSDLNL